MRRYALFLNFLFFIFVGLAQDANAAALSCENIFVSSDIRININRRDDIITDSQIAQMSEIIHLAGAMVAPYFKLPDEITMKVHYRSRDANASGFVMEVPYQIVESKVSDRGPKSPRHTRAVIAHEFGHILFSRNIFSYQKQFLESIRNYYRTVEPHYDSMLEEMNKLIDISYELDRKRSDSLKINEWELPIELQNAINENKRQMAEFRKKLPANPLALFDLREFRMAYEELFADVLAVSVMRNPHAIYASIFPISRSKESVYARDFLRPMNAENWDRAEVHELFGPTRYALSIHPKAVALYEKNPGRLVRLVFDAISDDFRELLQEAHNLPKLSPSIRNTRLIQRLNILLDNVVLAD